MKIQDQLNTSTTNANDCLRSCLAILLEEDAESIPNFTNCQPSDRDESGLWAKWHKSMCDWLALRGLAFIEIALVINQPWVGIPSGAIDCVFIGTTPQGISHAVVGRCEGREFILVHDPHPLKVGLAGNIDSVCFLVPFTPPKEKRIITFNN